MAVREATQLARMRASQAACLIFIEDGTDLTIAELASRIGLNERTFYRYFARREEVIRPVLEAGIELMEEIFRTAAKDRPLTDVALEGFRNSMWGDHADKTRRLVPLLLADPALNQVWLSTIRDFERVILAPIANRIDEPENSLRAMVVAGAIVTASRVSFEHMAAHGTDPVETFAQALAILEQGLPGAAAAG
jgi:AcrR family transcriptional regulator